MSEHRGDSYPPDRASNTAALLERIGASVIGEDHLLDGPFGPRRITYADYTASGRSLSFIEDYIRDVVLPTYANTHTEASGTGLQTTRLREQARGIIREALGTSADTAVIFCGAGTTSAIDKLIGILNLRIPADLDAQWGLSSQIPPDRRPVVFVGPFEHHSNEISWRETIAEVVPIRADASGHIDLEHLAEELAAHADRPLRIGAFSAASNVTGILSDTHAVTALLHRHGALAFWDFAAAGPYIEIAMDGRILADGSLEPGTAKDAVFLSPHKFIGGPGTPGILALRRRLATNRVPVVPGGGTVAFVTPLVHAYLPEIEHREEGGTPAIVEAVRAGLVVQLKQAVGTAVIRDREARLLARAFDRWRDLPGLDILGDPQVERLAIVSFVVRPPGRRALHHNFVVALLNDLFGIQARGGCSCAGPYGHHLLGIGAEHSAAYRGAIAEGCEGLKPGWVRLNLNYFVPEVVIDYLIEAVDLIARHGHRLLGEYRFSLDTGLWRHRSSTGEPRTSLTDITYDESGVMTYRRDNRRAPVSQLAEYLAEARRVLGAAVTPGQGEGEARAVTQHRCIDALDPALRWFELPAECLSGVDEGTLSPAHE